MLVRRFRLAVKRGMDIALSLAALVVLSPALALAAAAVYLRMGMPVFFRQTRPGLGGRPFTLYKLRTMTPAAEDSLQDSERLTGLGRFLRRWSLDELPQLWNVLKGDMSLVGPRPLLMEYLGRYTPEQMRRHEMRPGLTGWAQVNGRNAIAWEEKFRLDVWYVDNWTLWLDLRILARSLGAVLGGAGVSAPGEATSPMFTGNPETDGGRGRTVG